MGADAARPDDGAAVDTQIGRPSRAAFDVVVRCHLGLPVVIRMPPLLDDGTPFPTRYWLTCPLAVRRIDRSEAAGGVGEMTERAESDPDFGARLAAAHERYAADRDAGLRGDAELRPVGGVAGITGAGVKCLHAHYADRAAGYDNPVGEWVAPQVEPLNCSQPCVVATAAGTVRNPEWSEPAPSSSPAMGGGGEPAHMAGSEGPAHQASPTTRRAGVDIGTNTARLLIADVRPDGTFDILHRAVVVTRLGWGLDESGIIAEQSMARAEQVLAGFAGTIAAAGAAEVAAVATSATREAANQAEFLGRVEGALGVRPRVIDGDEEASLSFRGATLRHRGRPPFLVIDPGGGSTEFVLGSQEVEYSMSVQMGSVRLTDRALPRHPAPEADVAAAAAEARRAFAAVRLPATPGTVVGVGGTFTALAAMALDLGAYDPAEVDGAIVAAAQFDGVVHRLAGMSVEETAAIPSLDPERAPVLLGGAIVVREAVRHTGAAEVVVSEDDLVTALALGSR